MTPPGPTDRSPARGGVERRGRAVPILLLLLLTAFIFRPALFGGGVFYYRDILQNHRPVLAAIRAALTAGRLPWWNPYLGLGQPLLANPNHLALHPATWLLAAVPLDAAVTLSIVLGTALALTGMFLLLRELQVGPAAAFLGASAYGLSGLFLSFGNLPNLLGSASWLPLCLFWVLRFWGRPTARRALPAVLATALLWVCAEVATLAAFFLTASALMLAAADRSGAPQSGRPVVRRGLQLAGIAAAGGLVAAVQWLPFLELLARSRRGGGFPFDIAARWSLPPLRLPEVLIPHLFGDPTSLDVRRNWGLGVFETGFPLMLSIYVGPVVLLLAAALFAGRPRRREVALFAVVVLSVVVALGRHTPLFGFLHQNLPGFGSIRYPIRFLLGAQLGVAILAAIGLDRVLDGAAAGTAGRRCRNAFFFACPALVAIGVAGAATGVTDRAAAALLGTIGNGAAPESIIPLPAAAIGSGLYRMILLCGLCWLALYLHRRWSLRAAVVGWTIALLVAADLGAAGGGAIAVASSDLYRAGAAQGSDPVWLLRAQDGLHRVQRHPRPPGVRVHMPDDSVVWGYGWDRDTLSRATPVEFGIRMGYGEATDYLDLARPAAFHRRARQRGTAAELRVLCRSGVRFLLSYEEIETATGARQVAWLGNRSDPPVRLYELPCAVPRVYATAGVRLVTDRDEAEEILMSEGFDPRATVLLEGPGSVTGAAVGVAGPVPCRLAVDAPGLVEVEVSADRPAWVVLVENDYPGWKAWVDGEARPLRTANGLFQAVAVPPGDHRVRFEFRPGSLWRGSVLALIGLLVAVRVLPRRASRRPAAAGRRRVAVSTPEMT